MGFFADLLRPRARAASSSDLPVIGSDQVSDWYLRNGYGALVPEYASISGVAVSGVSSLQLSAVYACVKITAEDVASQPAQVQVRSVDRKSVEVATDDPRYGLFRYGPNPDMGAGEFIEALTARAVFSGLGAALVENPGKATMRLWPLGANDQIRVDRDRNRRTVWIVKEGSAPEKTLSREQVFVLRGYTWDGRDGDQVLRHAREIIGLGLKAQRYASAFLNNDIGASLVLEHPGKVTPDGVKAIKRAWRTAGEDEPGTPRVLQEGMKAGRMDPDLEKQQLMETRKHQIEEIARLFRMPLHKLAHLERMTFNNVEELQIDYESAVMNPWRRRWREAFHRHLLDPNEQLRGRIYLELVAEGMLRGQFKDQADGFARLLLQGVYSINEVRRWLDLNPIEGGDRHFMQMQMRDVEALAGAEV